MKWDWHGVVGVILALSVLVVLVVLSLDEYTHAGHVSIEEATLLATVLGATIGAVAVFLGRPDEKDKD